MADLAVGCEVSAPETRKLFPLNSPSNATIAPNESLDHRGYGIEFAFI